jgi:excisionase family DNA binding protein
VSINTVPTTISAGTGPRTKPGTARNALLPARDFPGGRAEVPQTANAPLPVLHTATDVAAMLCTSPKAVYTMVERGQLPGAIRVGRRLLFRREPLLEWLSEKSGAPSPIGDRR